VVRPVGRVPAPVQVAARGHFTHPTVVPALLTPAHPCEHRRVADDEPRQVPVRLLGMPLRVRARSMEHDQDLLRELALVRVSADSVGTTSAPSRLLDLADELRATYGPLAAGPSADMERALDEGREFMDVTYTVPDGLRPFLHRVLAVLDEVERFAREGRYLLTMSAPPDVAAYRAWVFGEFDRQLAGADPTPWSGAPAGDHDPRRVR
jgi:hypothetical protein